MIQPSHVNDNFLHKMQSLCFLLLIISSIAIWSRYHFPATPGVAWRILLANRLLDGQQIGRDIYELNTPFSDLLYIPPALVSRVFHLSSSLTTYLFTALYGYLCIHISSLILKYRGYLLFQQHTNLTIFRISFLCAFLFSPSLSFSEREHFIAASILPYAFIKMAPNGLSEAENEHKNLLNFLAYTLASIAVMIKPHYALSLLAIHGISLYAIKKPNSFYSGSIIFIFFSFLSVLSIFFFFPDYFKILYYAWSAYSGYNNSTTNTILSLINSTIIPLLLFIFFYSTNKSRFQKHKEFIITIITIVTASSLVIIAQKKGWEYQKLTATIPLWGLIIFNIYDYIQHHKKGRYFITITVFMLIINHEILRYSSNHLQSTLLTHQQGWPNRLQKYLRPHDNFTCISYDVTCPFSFDDLAQTYTYTSPYLDLWPTIGAMFLKREGKISQSSFNKIFYHDIQNIMDDIKRHHPKAIIFVWPKNKDESIYYFSNNKEISKMLSRYILIEHIKTTSMPGISTWIYIKK